MFCADDEEGKRCTAPALKRQRKLGLLEVSQWVSLEAPIMTSPTFNVTVCRAKNRCSDEVHFFYGLHIVSRVLKFRILRVSQITSSWFYLIMAPHCSNSSALPGQFLKFVFASSHLYDKVSSLAEHCRTTVTRLTFWLLKSYLCTGWCLIQTHKVSDLKSLLASKPH